MSYVLHVDVWIVKNGAYGGDSLKVQHEVTIKAEGFDEVAGVVKRFHELAETIRSENVPEPEYKQGD